MKTLNFLNVIITFVLSSLFFQVFSQNGPGGIGNKDGSLNQPKIAIWYDASKLNLNNGDLVEVWPDLSGNYNFAIQSNNTNKPTFIANAINNLPAVYFSDQKFMLFDGSPLVNSDYTVLAVTKRRSTGSTLYLFGGTSSSSNSNLSIGFNNTNIYNIQNYNDFPSPYVSTSETYSGGTNVNTYGIFGILLSSTEINNQRRTYQNNDLRDKKTANEKLVSFNGAALGRYLNYYSNVEIAEFIIFSSALNDAQLQIVFQYLNEKYQINIKNDLFDAPNDYKTGITGIGEASNGKSTLGASNGLWIKSLSGTTLEEYLFVSNNGANNSPNDFTSADLPSNVELRYNRIWYFKKVGEPDAQIIFDFKEATGISRSPAPDYANYVLLFRSSTTGNFSIIKSADGINSSNQLYFNLSENQIQDGYYTLGTLSQTQTPLEGVNYRIWYTLISGDWDNWEVWTLDPSGALPNNPEQLTPTTSPTAANDRVVILNGKTVTVNSNNKQNYSLTVHGRLDFGTTTGHSFNYINGTGRILLAADNFPSGDATNFVKEGLGEGTVVYYGGNYTLSTPREFFNVEVNLDNKANVITMLKDYQINGSLKIIRGNFRINDDVSTTILNLTINKNLEVFDDGRLSVGQGNTIGSYQIGETLPTLYHSIFHQIKVGGDLINEGIIKLCNLNAPVYNSLTDKGAVTFTFTGYSNNVAVLNDTTWFYNLIIDKGEDKTYTLEVISKDILYFVLMGPNSVGRTTGDGYTNSDPQVRKALWIRRGTLKLTGRIHIPTLSEGMYNGGNGDWAIGQYGRLWLASPNVTVYSTATNSNQIPGFETTASGINTGTSNQAISIYGELVISEGFLGTRNSAGIITWSDANSIVRIEGGYVDVAQYRSAHNGSGRNSFIMTNGTLFIRGKVTESGEVTPNYPIFDFESSNSIFEMHGGLIHIIDVSHTTSSSDKINGFKCVINEGNYNITGGKFLIEIDNNKWFQIKTNVPLYNFEIKNRSNIGNIKVYLAENLKIQNDLIIGSLAELNTIYNYNNTNYNLWVGGNFTLRNNGIFTANTSTVYFYGNKNSEIVIEKNDASAPLVFYNLEINKDQIPEVGKYYYVSLANTGRTTDPNNPFNIALRITNNFKINRGIYNTFAYKTSVQGNLEIIDGAITYNQPEEGRILLDGTNVQQINSSVIKLNNFGILELKNSAGAKLLNDIIADKVYLTTGIFDLDINNLRVNKGVFSTSGNWSNTLMFKTAGNASDGGLTMYIDLNIGNPSTPYTFPVGTGTMYTPLLVYKDAIRNYQGYITVKPADEYHPATSDPSKTIPYYWVVKIEGFNGINENYLKYTFYYPGSIPPSQNKGAVLSDIDFQWYEYNSVVSGNYLNFPWAAKISGDFTVGNKSVFNQPRILYSRYSTNPLPWNDKNSWSESGYNGPATNKAPESFDVIKIGYHRDNITGEYFRHRIYINQAMGQIRCAYLILEQNPDANLEENKMSRLILEPGAKLTVSGKITGNGEIQFRMSSTIQTTQLIGDMNEFIETKGASFICRSDGGEIVIPSNLKKFPRLSIAGYSNNWALSNAVVRFDHDITCHSLNVRNGATLKLSSSQYGDIYIQDSLRIGGIGADISGRILFPAYPSSPRTIIVGGDLSLDTDGSINTNNTLTIETNSNTDVVDLFHYLYVYGNIHLRDANAVFDLYSDITGTQPNVMLYLYGENNSNFKSVATTTPELYGFEVNKSPNKYFSFDDNFYVGAAQNNVNNAVLISSGQLRLNHPAINLKLSTNGATFKINSVSSLWLNKGAQAYIDGDKTNLWLDGEIFIDGGSILDLSKGTNNYIEYTSSGNAKIIINEGKLFVGTSLRRQINTELGVLKLYLNTSKSELWVSNQISETPNRGVLEILNKNSHLTLANGALIVISNSQKSGTFPTLYLDPDTYSLDYNSTIQFGSSKTNSAQKISVFSAIALPNVVLDNSSNNSPEVSLSMAHHTIAGNLTINTGTILKTNNFNLILLKNFTCYGKYIAGTNTTFFSGSETQNIAGAIIFYKLTKNTENTLLLNSPIFVKNDLSILSGVLNDNGKDIIVEGDIYNHGTHIWGGSGDGIIAKGQQQQTLVCTGEFGKLTINNHYGVYVPTTANSIIINNRLKLINGVFDIGKNLLIMRENAIFEEGNPFGENNMVQTNISFTDNGVKKYFANNYTGTFVFPIGSQNKYTPIVMNITNTSAGSIRVKAANEVHPTIVEDSEECSQNIDDLNNVLQYYWTMSADENLTNYTATVYMYYYPSDARVTAPYTLDDYITAKLIEGEILWNKFDYESFDQFNKRLIFYFSVTDKTQINGDYTAGVQVTCGSAIPDQIPVYISMNSGNWTDKNNWATYNIYTHERGLAGVNVPTGGPRGAYVIIDYPHTITMNQNYIKNYRTTINGILNVGTTYAQRLGIVDGDGELYAERGEIPAGVYDKFVLPNTGTFHFGGNSDYDVLNQLPIVNNLKFSGTGQRRLPNLDLVLNGKLIIDGADNSLQVINEFSRTIYAKDDLIKNNGIFVAGTGPNAVVVINGTKVQKILGNGTFTGNSAFYHFKMNNLYGLILNKPIDISQTLTFQRGIIFGDAQNYVKFTNATSSIIFGDDKDNYIDAATLKLLYPGQSFTYPVGNAGRYAPTEIYSITSPVEDYWTVQYYNDNPLNAGMNPANFDSPLQYVSENEYWRINGPANGTAYIRLRWDALSGASEDENERQDMRIAFWNSSVSKWQVAHTSSTASGTQLWGTITTEPTYHNCNNNKYFTLSTTKITINTWTGLVSQDWNNPGNWSLNKVPTSTTIAQIPSNPTGNRFPIVYSTASVQSLIVQNNGKLTINPGAFFTAYGTINNNGTIELKSPNNSNASASLIDNGITGTGIFKIERYITANSFHYVSSPIQAGGNATSALFTRSHPTGYYNYNFYKYNEAYDLDGNPSTAPGGTYNQQNLALAWEYAHNGPTGPDENLIPKKGYAFWTDENQMITFIGTPNTGPMNITGLSYTNNDPLPYQTNEDGVPQLYDGWHLVGNPYPSAIDWDLIKNNLTNIDEGIYVWDGNQYANYVNGISSGSGNLNNIIPPMQGFFVRANASNAGFALNNSHRVHNNSEYFKNSSKKPKDLLLTIAINANGFTSKTNIYFEQNATSNYDSRFDAIAMLSYYDYVPDLFTIGSNGIKYSTNGLNTEALKNSSIPLGLKLQTTGQYTLDFNLTSGFDSIQVLLEDKYTNSFVNLKQTNCYTFNHNGLPVTDRFVIHFIKNTAPQVNAHLPIIHIYEDSQFSFTLPQNLFIDNDINDSLVYSVEFSQNAEWLEYHNNLTLTGIPTNENVGINEVFLTATDRYGAKATTSLTINVINVNDAPIVIGTIPDVEVKAYDELLMPLNISQIFKDVDANDQLKISIFVKNHENLPDFITYNADNSTIILNPTNADVGIYTIIVRATDLGGEFAETSFTCKVIEALYTPESDVKVSVWPNPTESYVTISTPYKNYIYEISDASGKVLLKNKSTTRKQKVDLSNFAPGQYMIRLKFEDNSVVTKQIIKK